MPLPAALQERLLKRGLLANENNKEKTEIIKKRSTDVEEVFAESYDEPDEPKINKTNQDVDLTKVIDCPNRTNEFHECSSYCAKKYGYKKFQPHPVMEKRRIRMLKIYPLPPNWVEVPDINTNRYYYWNTETNHVCWISPSHPKAKLELPIKQKISETANKNVTKEIKSVDFSSFNSEDMTSSKIDRPKQNKKYKPKDDLDPMDPSAYSDIPRGKWSAGLDAE